MSLAKSSASEMLHLSLVRMNVQQGGTPLYAAQDPELLGYPQHQEFREQCTYIFSNFEK